MHVLHHGEADRLGRIVEIAKRTTHRRRLRKPLPGSGQLTLTTPSREFRPIIATKRIRLAALSEQAVKNLDHLIGLEVHFRNDRERLSTMAVDDGKNAERPAVERCIARYGVANFADRKRLKEPGCPLL